MGYTFVNTLCLAVVAALAVSTVQGEVVDVTPENVKSVMDGSSNLLLEFYAPWCGHCKKLAPEYEILGEQFSKEKDDVVIAKVDSEKYAALASTFGVTGYPTLKWMPKGKSASADAEAVNAPRTADGLGDFIADKTGIKPRKAPKAPSAVLDLTVDTFDSIVLDPSKHALVEFFAPWCGHCKSLAPVYEKLGKAFEVEKNIVIAKVDATEEKELGTRFGITGFPSLKYFPAGEADMEAFNGGRDLDSMVGFLNSKAGTSRTSTGGLSSAAGRLEALDAVLASASGASTADLTSKLEEAVNAAGYAEGSDAAASAGHYTRAAKKIADKGDEYVETELKRLEGLLTAKGSHAVSPVKKTLFMVRSNILKAFAEHGFGGKEDVAVTATDAAGEEEL